MISRYHDWPERLEMMLEAARTRPFRYGYHDCVSFTCRCVEAITGVKPIQECGLEYKTKRELLNRLVQFGGLDQVVQHVVDHYSVEQHESVQMARRGDPVVLHEIDEYLFVGPIKSALGIVDNTGRNVVFPAHKVGIVQVPLSHALRAWRLG